MPRVERKIAEGEVPVPQAQLIDPSGFRADTSSAEALKIAANFTNTMAELAKRRQEAQDSQAATKAGHSRTLAELEMQQFMVDSPDPNTWEEGLAKISAKYSANYASLKMSNKTKKEQDIEQQAHNDEMAMRVRLAATNQDIKNDITEAKINLDSLIANDDGDVGDADKIDKAMKALEAALLRETTPEIAAEQMEEALSAAKKGYWINQSKLRPDEIIAQMEKKKKGLGKKGEDKDGLTAKDMDDIIGSAYRSKALSQKSLDTQQEADRDELGQGLQDGTITYAKINATSLNEKEQESFRLKMNAEAKRKAEDVPIAIDRRIERDLETMAYRLSAGGSITEFRNALDNARFPEKGNPFIDDASQQRIKALGEGRFASYQDEAMHDREVHALGQLVTLPREEDFTEMINRLTSKFDKEQAQTLRQLQFDNLDRYKNALRKLREDHPDWGAGEIYEEGRSLLTQYKKTPDELRGVTELPLLPPDKFKLSVLPGIGRKKEKQSKPRIIKERKPSDRFKGQLDYLSLLFKLSKEETNKARELLDQGATLDELTKHLQGKK